MKWYDSPEAQEIIAVHGANGTTYRELGGRFGRTEGEVKGLIKWWRGQQERKEQGVEQDVRHDREIGRLSARLRELQRKYEKAIQLYDLQERVIEVVTNQVQAMPVLGVPPLSVESSTDFTEEVGLLLSDVHGGERVSPEETLGFGRYSFKTMCHRLAHLAERVVYLTQKALSGYNFWKLHIFGLGDFVPGEIHLDTVKASEGNIIEWTFGTAAIVAQMVGQLARVFPEIEVECVIGNHGRLSKKPPAKEKYVNWDYVCYTLMSLLLANQTNVRFKINKSFWMMKTIGERNYLALHGDDIRSWMGIPYYGIDRAIAALTELFAARGDFLDYILMGHFHNAGLLDKVRGEKVINGSVSGPNEFSLTKRMASEPKQVLFGIHPNHGITWTFKVNLADAPEPDVPVYTYDMGGRGDVNQMVEILRGL